VSETEELTRGTPEACPRCGEPAGTFRFCLSCGADVLAPVPVPVPVSAAAKPSRLRRVLRRVVRVRTPLVVLPLLAGLTVVGGMGASMLTEEIPPPVPHTQVACWDGSGADSLDDCVVPAGVEGLRWVFPTFHPNRDSCVDMLVVHPEYLRPAMYQCDFKVPKAWVTVTYNELASVEAARKYFEKQYSDADREQVRTAEGTAYRYVWRQQTDEGYALAAMYMNYPYAVEIVAKSAKARDEALRKLDFRHPDKMAAVFD
jgi:hypothetical protein